MIAPMDLGGAHAGPADDFQSEIVDRLPVLQRATAVIERARPVTQIERDCIEPPEGPAGPPDVAPSLEDLERALAGPQRLPKLTPDLIHLAQTALGVRGDLFEATFFGRRGGFAAAGNRDIGLAARQAV